MLATSREPLHLRQEREFVLQPLTSPLAVELLEQRIRQYRPEFRVSHDNRRILADICMHLDGLPLAIELVDAL